MTLTSGAGQDLRGLEDCELEEVDGLGRLGPHTVFVEEGVIRAQRVENSTKVDIYKHVIVRGTVFGCLEQVGVVLDVLNGGE